MLTGNKTKLRWNGQVLDLTTGTFTSEQYSLDLGPRGAVIAAYAQSHCKDFNTADYEAKYGKLVYEGQFGFHLGNFSAIK